MELSIKEFSPLVRWFRQILAKYVLNLLIFITLHTIDVSHISVPSAIEIIDFFIMVMEFINSHNLHLTGAGSIVVKYARIKN